MQGNRQKLLLVTKLLTQGTKLLIRMEYIALLAEKSTLNKIIATDKIIARNIIQARYE